MNKQSGVQGSAAPTSQDPAFDPEAEANTIAVECAQGMNDSDILDAGTATTGIAIALPLIVCIAKVYLQPQHLKCHHPWTTLANRPGRRGADLLGHLAVLVSRDLLQLSSSQEDRAEGPQNPKTVALMKQVLIICSSASPSFYVHLAVVLLIGYF